ncbi:MAG: 30S ribosomal protein S6 [Anaerolineae bacterium]
MREYEFAMVVNPSLDNDGVMALVEQVGALVTGAGGQVNEVGQLVDGTGQLAATETWRRRRLAYPLDRNREGYFAIYRIQAPATIWPGIERQLKLNENVLRYMIIRADEE